MSEAYAGEIRLFAFTYAPEGWLLCNGAQMSNSHQPLFWMLQGKNIYGAGTNQFVILPNLIGRAAMGVDRNRHLNQHTGEMIPYNLGRQVGEPAVRLVGHQGVPEHSHLVRAAKSTPVSEMTNSATNLSLINILKSSNNLASPAYADAVNPGPAMNPLVLGASGAQQAQPHENRQPFLALNYCICFDGIYPTPA